MKKISKKILMSIMVLCMVSFAFTSSIFAAGTEVAEVDGTKYQTLQEAIDNADGKTVMLLDDVTESVTIEQDKNITIDLGKYTLTNEGSKHTITNNGNLTIEGEGKVDNTVHGKGALVNNKGGEVNINGGTFTRSNEKGVQGSNGGNSWYVIDNQGTMTIKNATVENTSGFSSLIRNLGATLNVEDGSVLRNAFIAVKNDDNGVLNVNGGLIETTGEGGSAIQNWGKAEVNGGTLKAVDGAAAIFALSWDPQYSDSKIVVNDGVKVDGDVIVQVDTESKVDGVKGPELVVNGGDINGNISAKEEAVVSLKGGNVSGEITKVSDDAKVSISGGTYAKEINPEYVADDMIAIGYKKSGESSSTYMVGTVEEMKNKIESAKKGDEIEILNGSLDLNVENGGVSIVNKGNGDVTVNDEKVDDTGIVTENKDNDKDDNKGENDSTGTGTVTENNNGSNNDKGDVQSPDTSDNNNLTFFIGSTLVSLVALLAVLKKKFA